MDCKKCGSKNTKITAYIMESDSTFYECQECGAYFSDADKIKCSTCGDVITDEKNVIRIDGETFCSNTCAEEYTFFNMK